eukprot:254018-Amorphochlora_amoeboformis.AAC.1
MKRYDKPNEITLGIILRCLESSPPSACVEVLAGMAVSLDVMPNTIHFNSALRSCAHAQDAKTAQNIYKTMGVVDVAPNQTTLELIIRSHGGELSGIQKWIEEAKLLGFERDPGVMDAILHTHLQGSRNPSTVLKRFMDLVQNKEVELQDIFDARAVVKILTTLLQGNNKRVAKEFACRYLEGSRGIPDKDIITVFNFLIHHYSVEEEDMESADWWLNHAIHKQIPLSRIWFGSVSRVCIIKGDFDRARHRFRQMFELEVPRTIQIYNLIAGIGLGGVLGPTWKGESEDQFLLNLMRDDRVEPNEVTFRGLFSNADRRAAAGEEQTSRVVELIDYVEEHGISMDDQCRRYALRALDPKSQNFKEVRAKLFKAIEDSEVKAHEYLNQGDIDSAKKIVESLLQRGRACDQKLSCRLIRSLAITKRLDDAEKILNALPNPNGYHFTATAQIYAKEGNIKKVLELRDHVFRDGLSKMDLGSCEVILLACNMSEPRDVETAREILRLIETHGIKGNEILEQRVEGYRRSILGTT